MCFNESTQDGAYVFCLLDGYRSQGAYMKLYHVTYYYLASGMEGHADTADYGLVEADSPKEACEKVGKLILPNSDWRTQVWGLTAKEVHI